MSIPCFLFFSSSLWFVLVHCALLKENFQRICRKILFKIMCVCVCENVNTPKHTLTRSHPKTSQWQYQAVRQIIRILILFSCQPVKANIDWFVAMKLLNFRSYSFCWWITLASCGFRAAKLWAVIASRGLKFPQFYFISVHTSRDSSRQFSFFDELEIITAVICILWNVLSHFPPFWMKLIHRWRMI